MPVVKSTAGMVVWGAMEDARRFRFGAFVLDTRARELLKNGRRIRIRRQPYLILELLLARAGEVVTRDDIREKLWPADTFVDFERCLNTLVMNVRQTLGDSADDPHYIVTVPRVGYRFVAHFEAEGAATLPSAQMLTAVVNDGEHSQQSFQNGNGNLRQIEANLRDCTEAFVVSSRGAVSRRIKQDLMRYGLGVVVAVVALLVRKLADPFFGQQHPYDTMWLAVALSARQWRIGPSIATLVTGSLGIWYWLLPPAYSFQILDRRDLYGLVGFVALSAVMIFVSSFDPAKSHRA
jgi:DNA-binding winged helix-turn-helix (wHTH) protein